MALPYQQIKFYKCLTLMRIILFLSGCVVTTVTCSSLSQSQPSDCCIEVKESSQAVKSDLEETKMQLKKTQQALAELITTLLNDENAGNTLVSEMNRRAKRATSSSEEEDEGYDSILGHLPISALAGLRGRDGRDGKDGVQGPIGAPGKDGDDGRDGKDGAQGSIGIPGKDGDDGRDGKDGAQGSIGTPGTYGADGKNGRDGLQGAVGPQGRDGRDGVAGTDGEDGTNGINGRDGQPGNDGNPGNPGAPGEMGQPGPPGVPGEAGRDGNVGSPGVNGTAGHDGRPGTDGATGSPGNQGPPGRSEEDSGTVYTRWGRTTCGNSSTLLYHGFAGGSRYDQTGGGVNYQCLPLTPEYSAYNSGSTTTAYMAGSEYQTYSYGIFPNSALHRNVPCARCYTNNRSAVMLLPAKRTCPQSWNKEYEGYLMAERNSHIHPSTFECVDAHPEYFSDGGSNENGALFYFVKAICSGAGNTHHCPPYDANKQLTCVVCSK